MHRKFYLWLSLLSGIVLLIFTVVIGQKEVSPEYGAYQEEYKNLILKNSADEAVKAAAGKLEVGLKQIYLASLDRVDRCTNCHGIWFDMLEAQQLKTIDGSEKSISAIPGGAKSTISWRELTVPDVLPKWR